MLSGGVTDTTAATDVMTDVAGLRGAGLCLDTTELDRDPSRDLVSSLSSSKHCLSVCTNVSRNTSISCKSHTYN
jgi:hypothetical protein